MVHISAKVSYGVSIHIPHPKVSHFLMNDESVGDPKSSFSLNMSRSRHQLLTVMLVSTPQRLAAIKSTCGEAAQTSAAST